MQKFYFQKMSKYLNYPHIPTEWQTPFYPNWYRILECYVWCKYLTYMFDVQKLRSMLLLNPRISNWFVTSITAAACVILPNLQSFKVKWSLRLFWSRLMISDLRFHTRALGQIQNVLLTNIALSRGQIYYIFYIYIMFSTIAKYTERNQ